MEELVSLSSKQPFEGSPRRETERCVYKPDYNRFNLQSLQGDRRESSLPEQF